jgi:hypothetical protein
MNGIGKGARAIGPFGIFKNQVGIGRHPKAIVADPLHIRKSRSEFRTRLERDPGPYRKKHADVFVTQIRRDEKESSRAMLGNDELRRGGEEPMHRMGITGKGSLLVSERNLLPWDKA